MGLAGGAVALGQLASGTVEQGRVVSLVVDPLDPVASAAPARWALGELERSLSAAGCAVHRVERVEQAGAGDFCVVATGAAAPLARATLGAAGVAVPEAAEGLALAGERLSGRRAVVACGADTAGLVYALLEVADRVRHARTPDAALALRGAVAERPANAVRSVMRQFTSETLDKPWFDDREMWPRYLDLLATHRFNRFHLAFGLGYDSLAHVVDSYFLFLYPFLVSVPGHTVRATNLPDAERDRNLETLRFIGERTVERGLGFQLGIWTHGFRLGEGSSARHVIEGIGPEQHAEYCRDALATLLRACPAIGAVALRIHGESGVQEGSYPFWRTIFDGIRRCGRRVEIDLHAKGIDAVLIDEALATGLPVNVSAKYWAEHLGLPYHQSAIRELELPVPGRAGPGLMTLSEGSRAFTRYGYADLLREDRAYTVRTRVFSGTQRLLAWGDPDAAAAHARAFRFCGMTGVDLMEPLTCRGRRGTGVGTRLGYVDARLAPRWDWQKFGAWYRIWGRLKYDPETDPEVWSRELGGAPGARHLRAALASASRILPVVTTAYLPSAACDAYWPESYWNQSIVGEDPGTPYTDTPAPRTFQNASPLDPQLFSRMGDAADELLRGERSGKYSPLDVARWIEDLAETATRDLAQAGSTESPDRARLAIDIGIVAELGRFFAAKFRSGVLYAIHERTGDRPALAAALEAYRRARAHWAALAERARGVYQDDLSVSDKISERGHWADRLPGIDRDIDRMEARLASVVKAPDPRGAAAVRAVLAWPERRPAPCTHVPPAGFRPGAPIVVSLAVASARRPRSVRIYFRRVNQAERYQSAAMAAGHVDYRATIPAAYADSPYPVQYYFALAEGPERVWLYPGFQRELLNQPYFVLRRM